MATPSYRIEKDALGEVRVPADRLWGAQTQRSIENFPIGVDRFRWGRPVIRAFGVLKKCAALANGELGELPPEKVDLIVRAAQEVIDGKLDAEFPLVVFQTGSGTQSNMNANEVIANRAIQLAGGVVGSKKPIHPNDDVNRSQSSNDTFPAVMHIATVEAIDDELLPARARVARHARRQGARVRRHRDDRPHASAWTRRRSRSARSSPAGSRSSTTPRRRSSMRARGLYPLALGGTAVGTGLNAHARFGDAVAARDRRGDRQAVHVRRRTSSPRCRRTTRWSTPARRCARSAGAR